MNDVIQWAAGLPLVPKIILSTVVILIAVFILFVLWAPIPSPTIASVSKSPQRDPEETNKPAPVPAPRTPEVVAPSQPPPKLDAEKARPGSPTVSSPSVSATRVEGSVIISQGQVGGQVAHSITNVGPQPRRVSQEAQANLAKSLKEFSPMTYEIEVVAGEGEPRDLAFQIQAALNAGGWVSTAFANSMFPRPIVGLIISAPERAPSIEQFVDWARRAGLNPKLELLKDLKQVHVLVGTRE